ncbi:protein translocase subunit SecD [Pelagibacteraceae bacterium]|nr:protein translocase subunit SecD [Pelagibacteraceae bacterium]
MLQFSRSKITLIVATIFMAILLALPNIFTDERTSNFPPFIPSQKVNLGLDLQGGSHLLLEVDTESIKSEKIDDLSFDLRRMLKKNDFKYGNLQIIDDSIKFKLNNSELAKNVSDEIKKLSQSVSQNALSSQSKSNLNVEINNSLVNISLTEDYLKQISISAVNQSIEIVRRRIDELGTREPTIQKQGTTRILIQLPGLDDPERIKSLLGQTAKLTFKLVDQKASYDPSNPTKIPVGSELLPSDSDFNFKYIVKKKVMVGGENLVDAQPGFDPQTNEPVVNFRFDRIGAKKFGKVTKANIGKPFAIILDNKVVSAPVIRDAILGGSGQISGGFSAEEAADLAVLLRAGALPAPLIILEERSVGPDLGADSVFAGKIAALIGFVAVIIFMVLIYRAFGFFADIALILNLVMVLGVLSLLQATLTLPGIAGIILTIGMAVDANVLIFERIKEELRNGSSVINAIDSGYKRALSTILDANITTLIAASILFFMGSGPVKGFSVTLAIGIFTSVFTAFTVTRMMISIYISRRKPKELKL